MKLAILMNAQVMYLISWISKLFLNVVDRNAKILFLYIICFHSFFCTLICNTHFRMDILGNLDRLFSELWKWHQN